MRVIEIDTALEKNILIGMITSSSFLSKVAPIFDQDYFDTEASVTISNWILDYYIRYNQAPDKQIQAIFDEKGQYMTNDADYEWTRQFLVELSNEYESRGFNEQYLFDRAIQHFKKQKMKKSCSRVQELLDDGSINEAEDIWLDAMKISGEEDLGIDPFADSSVKLLMRPDSRFSINFGITPFDRLAGWQKSEWLIIIMAPMKRGKTLVLSHLAVHAALTGYRVVFISLESGYQDIAQRFWMNIGSLASRGDGRVIFPRFKDKNIDDEIKTKKIARPLVTDRKAVIQAVKKFRRASQGRLIMKSFPAYSAGLEEIDRYLDALLVHKNFIPHLIIVDYLGAMKPPARVYGRDIYDYNSRGLKGMSQKRKALVATGHQGSRETLKKLNMHPTDVPEDVRILANVDGLYGLDQTEEEKENNIVRFNVLMHRFRKFSRKTQAKILMQPEAGQFHIDSMMVDAPQLKNDSKKKEVKDD